MAQTRFVNSSPQSYRLMPASIESSDMTSFVEKTPHKYALRASFMLDVAELWELSKHSELECLFTFAHSVQDPGDFVEETKLRRPICHSSVVPACVPCPWGTSTSSSSKYLDFADEIKVKESAVSTGIDTDLLRHVKRFLKSQELREKYPMGIAGFINTAKLGRPPSCHRPRLAPHRMPGKHKLVSSERVSEDRDLTNDSLTPLVKLLTVNSPNDPPVSRNGKTFILHMLPFTQYSVNKSSTSDPAHISSNLQNVSADEPPLKKSRPVGSEDQKQRPPTTKSTPHHTEGQHLLLTTADAKSSYECFYCSHTFLSKNDCARHMLEHLAADSPKSESTSCL